ncbi:MAG: hypothetical protein UY48_C0043G0009 [Candidatus Gottesmanbacteria bacterium GW2011_GWB1_49_7]|uniref:Uncharacterized protein n=1 Tax=Candidatus Gottesmanbacteria bacterium GW2011_GWB1_49_7 TaxID=1618448 RepID=A0A0G1YV69_9BACT|nr:MAG: hypothetical protein UY48_C0043G0009 [Candidatus Gottesmanbacteria bacterium GW2011_GWB1_49_7]
MIIETYYYDEDNIDNIPLRLCIIKNKHIARVEYKDDNGWQAIKVDEDKEEGRELDALIFGDVSGHSEEQFAMGIIYRTLFSCPDIFKAIFPRWYNHHNRPTA